MIQITRNKLIRKTVSVNRTKFKKNQKILNATYKAII